MEKGKKGQGITILIEFTVGDQGVWDIHLYICITRLEMGYIIRAGWDSGPARQKPGHKTTVVGAYAPGGDEAEQRPESATRLMKDHGRVCERIAYLIA